MEFTARPEFSECVSSNNSAYERKAEFDDDVVIVAAVRTPICRAKRGGFKDTIHEDILAAVLKAVVKRSGVAQEEVGDIVVGIVLGPGGMMTRRCRMAMFYAGFPETVPIRTLNRQCGSGLQAIADVAACIKAGFYDIGIGAGVESMTSNYGGRWEGSINPKVNKSQGAKDCLLPMGLMSENVSEAFNITRKEQDESAVVSHFRAAVAADAGKFKDEIIPVHTKLIDARTGEKKLVTISADDGIRPGTNISDLSKLMPAFKKEGSTTAGNSSQVSDGASAVLLMKRYLAVQRHLPILGIFRSFIAVGVNPAINGIGPAVAIPKAVKAAGLEVKDISLFEINEAFASQYVYCCKALGLDMEKVNVNGGAVALGHPLGSTGVRCTATMLHEMQRRGRDCRYGVVSMCIGSGMGAASVFERGNMFDSLSNCRNNVRSNL
eukprot:c24476_g1_i1 orf=169-1476(+)